MLTRYSCVSMIFWRGYFQWGSSSWLHTMPYSEKNMLQWGMDNPSKDSRFHIHSDIDASWQPWTHRADHILHYCYMLIWCHFQIVTVFEFIGVVNLEIQYIIFVMWFWNCLLKPIVELVSWHTSARQFRIKSDLLRNHWILLRCDHDLDPIDHNLRHDGYSHSLCSKRPMIFTVFPTWYLGS